VHRRRPAEADSGPAGRAEAPERHRDENAGAPHEITPQTGDQFTVLEKWLDLDATDAMQKEASQKGKTLTFGKQTFTCGKSLAL
jgi:hypothetical protein